jgi:exopolysaccharide biosynthesis polyprenyl glycosylphosphotransferase
MRRHLVRSFARVTTLLAADLGGYLVARVAIRAIRDQEILGSTLAQALNVAVPLGSLGGWQLGAALLLGLAVTGNYGRGDRRRNPAALFAGVALGTALSVWAPLWQSGLQAVAMQFGATTLGMWLALVAERRVLDWLVRRVAPADSQAERVVFVGDPGNLAGARVQQRLAPNRGGMMSLGWVSTNGTSHAGLLGHVSDFWDLVQRHSPDTVVLCGHLEDDEFEAVVSASIAAGCRLLAVPRYEGLAEVRPGLVWEGGLPLVELTVPSLRARQLLAKRIIDLVVSGLGLVFLAPVVGLVALGIKLDSPGPVFFSQRRVGLGGRTFRMLKFRTMRVGADGEKAQLAHLNHTGDPRLFKIPNDPRVTKVGALLRRWSVDELPQVWNVFLGHMSLVGPRPFFESDLEGYLDHHFVRLGAKPGITGLWQVNGRSSVVDFEEVVRLDREYVERWSLWLDVKILFQTLPAVLRRTGAF